MGRSQRSRYSSSSKRSLRQPSLYSRTEDVGEKRSYGWVFVVIFILALGALAYGVFFSPVLAVKHITFSDTKYVNREEIQKTISGNHTILDNNIITFGIFGLESRLERVTGIENVTILRKFPSDIEIKIGEKSPLLVWQFLDKKVLVDEDGYAWANYEDKYASLPVVIDTKNVPVTLGNKILPRSFTQFFVDMESGFEVSSGQKIVKVEVMDIVSDMKVTTGAGWYVYFDTTRSAKGELVSLARVVQDAKNKKHNLEYVDLRIDNRIFYK